MSNKLVGHIYSPDAIHGKSAYELAVMHGFDGTEEEWIKYQITEAERKAQEIADKALEDVDTAKEAAIAEIDNQDRTLISNAIKNTANGNVIVLNDVSPLAHILSVKARSENLLTYPYHSKTSTDFGITFTDNKDGSITINGTSTNSVNFNLEGQNSFTLPIGEYYISLTKTGVYGEIYTVIGGAPSTAGVPYMMKDGKFSVTKEGTLGYCLIQIPAGQTFENCVVYPQIVKGTKAKPYKPFVDVSKANVIVNDTETYHIGVDGTAAGVKSVSPTMTLTTDEGVELDVEYNRDANKVIAELFALIQGSPSSRISYIDLPSANWKGSGSPYSQVVTIDGVTEFSKVDINPSIEQLAIFHTKDIAFVAENEDGKVTVYCIGQKPTADYQMQITITEVNING